MGADGWLEGWEAKAEAKLVGMMVDEAGWPWLATSGKRLSTAEAAARGAAAELTLNARRRAAEAGVEGGEANRKRGRDQAMLEAAREAEVTGEVEPPKRDVLRSMRGRVEALRRLMAAAMEVAAAERSAALRAWEAGPSEEEQESLRALQAAEAALVEEEKAVAEEKQAAERR